MRNKRKNRDSSQAAGSVWTSFSDLYTSLAIIFLVMFIVAILKESLSSLATFQAQLKQEQTEVEHKEFLEGKVPQKVAQQVDESKAKLIESIDSIDQQKQQLNSRINEINELVKSLSSHKKIVAGLLETQTQKDAVLANVKSVIAQKNQTIAELKKETKDTQRELKQSYKQKIEEINKKIKEQDQKSKQKQEKLKSLEQQKSELLAKIEKKNQSNEQLQDQLEKQKGQYESKLNQQREKLQAKLSQQKSQFASASDNQKEKFENRISEVQNMYQSKISDQQAKHQSELSKQKQQYESSLAKAGADHNSKQANSSAKIESLKKALSDAMESKEQEVHSGIAKGFRKSLAAKLNKRLDAAGSNLKADPNTGNIVLYLDESFLFNKDSATLKVSVKEKIRKVMPIYLEELLGDKVVRNNIASINITGHASPRYDSRPIDPNSRDTEAYYHNLKLSTSRAMEVTRFIFSNDFGKLKFRSDLQEKIQVSGKSYMSPIPLSEEEKAELGPEAGNCGNNSCKRSRRVEISFSLQEKLVAYNEVKIKK